VSQFGVSALNMVLSAVQVKDNSWEESKEESKDNVIEVEVSADEEAPLIMYIKEVYPSSISSHRKLL
jgi:hypothetical protein